MQVKLVVVAALSAGCSFPDVTFGGGSATGGGGDGSGAAPATGGNGGSNGGSTPIGGAAACDVDEDGAQIEAPGCCTVPTKCDCDDGNPDVFPAQMKFFDVMRPEFSNPAAPEAFDYDCDDVSEPEFPKGNCIDLGACATPTDDVVFVGPNDAYACGAPGTRRYCATGCEQVGDILGCR